jgi:hypothetical protein
MKRIQQNSSNGQSSLEPLRSLVSSQPCFQRSKRQWLLGWEMELELQSHWHGHDAQRELQGRLIRPQRPQQCAGSDMHLRAHIHARSPGSGIELGAVARLKPQQPTSSRTLFVCC